MDAHRPEVVIIPTPGLGNSSYLVGVDAEAVAIDVPRDAWRIAGIAEEHGWRITHALETHVHNDYLSGARELEAVHGTRIVAPGRGEYAAIVKFAPGGARGRPPHNLSWLCQP